MDLKNFVSGVQHIGIPTNHMEKTLEFYHKLGFTTSLETVNEAAGERVAFLALGNLTIEAYENHCAVGTSGAVDHIALDTTDIEAAYQAVGELGIPLPEEGISSLPFWAHGVKFFTILGPNGEKIEFCQKL